VILTPLVQTEQLCGSFLSTTTYGTIFPLGESSERAGGTEREMNPELHAAAKYAELEVQISKAVLAPERAAELEQQLLQQVGGEEDEAMRGERVGAIGQSITCIRSEIVMCAAAAAAAAEKTCWFFLSRMLLVS
jgi:hypothetical protein